MAKNIKTDNTNTTTTTRAKRTPRPLTTFEIQAKQQLADAKALAKITPLIDKLTANGRKILVEYLETPEASVPVTESVA